MTSTVFEKPAALKNCVVIDDIVVKILPDCPKCGRNEYRITGTGLYLICTCGAKYFNRGRI